MNEKYTLLHKLQKIHKVIIKLATNIYKVGNKIRRSSIYIW